MQQRSPGATWPDVGLAIVEFAREDTLRFLVVFAVMGAVLWFLFPMVTRMLEKSYLPRLRKGAKEKRRVHAESDADGEHEGEHEGDGDG